MKCLNIWDQGKQMGLPEMQQNIKMKDCSDAEVDRALALPWVVSYTSATDVIVSCVNCGERRKVSLWALMRFGGCKYCAKCHRSHLNRKTFTATGALAPPANMIELEERVPIYRMNYRTGEVMNCQWAGGCEEKLLAGQNRLCKHHEAAVEKGRKMLANVGLQ